MAAMTPQQAGWSVIGQPETDEAPPCAGSYQRLAFPAAYAVCGACGGTFRVMHSAADLYELSEHWPAIADAPTLALGL